MLSFNSLSLMGSGKVEYQEFLDNKKTIDAPTGFDCPEGLSQKDVSGKLGFTNPQFISNIERSLAEVPPKHWRKLAKLYKCSTQVFYDMALEREIKRLKGYL